MIVSSGLGDDEVDVSGEDGVGPSFNGVYFTFALIGIFAFVSVFSGSRSRASVSSASRDNRKDRTERESREWKLEVDVTGRGNWVEQATGSKREVGKIASQVRAREGMKTRLVPL